MPPKPKILLLFTQMYPYGKEETFIEDEIEIIRDRFEKIFIFTSSTETNRRKVPDGIKVVRLNFSNITYIDSFKAFGNKLYWKELLFLFKKDPLQLFSFGIQKTIIYSLLNAKVLSENIFEQLNDQVDIHNSSLFFYSYWINDFALAFVMLKNTINGKFFCRAHGWDIYLERSRYKFLPFRNILPVYLDRIYFISRTGWNYYSSRYGIYDNLVISRLGVKNQLPSTDVSIINKELTLLSCSLIIPIKRIELIINSLALLKDIKYKWYHIGYDLDMGSSTHKLVEMAKRLEVNFKPIGFIRNDEVHQFYQNQRVDLFINLSTTEGIPVSIMEAYSYGVPAIATNVGGTSEIVTNENGQLLNATPSLDEINTAIRNFHNLSPEQVNLKKQAAYKTWQEKYNAKTNYTQFVEDILSL